MKLSLLCVTVRAYRVVFEHCSQLSLTVPLLLSIRNAFVDFSIHDNSIFSKSDYRHSKPPYSKITYQSISVNLWRRGELNPRLKIFRRKFLSGHQLATSSGELVPAPLASISMQSSALLISLIKQNSPKAVCIYLWRWEH